MIVREINLPPANRRCSMFPVWVKKAQGLRDRGLGWIRIFKSLQSECNPPKSITQVRYWLNPNTRAKKHAYDRIRQKTMRREIAAKQHIYYLEHREEYLKKMHEYRLRTLVVRRKQNHEYCRTHTKEKHNYDIAYINKNRQRIYTRQHIWAKTTIGRLCSQRGCHSRRAKIIKADGSGFTCRDILILWETQQGRCHWCQTLMARTGSKYQASYCNIDHVVPLARGGKHDISNIVLSCHRCNIRKGKKLPQEWQHEIARNQSST